MVITVSSPDPNVTFAIVGAPVTITCCLPGNDCQALRPDDCAARGGAEVASCDACPLCSDDDGDGVTTCDGDCDDTDAAILPGADEVCDGRDNNCDGSVDEELADCVPCDDDAGCDDGDPGTIDACLDGRCIRSRSVDFAAISLALEEEEPGVVNITPIISVTSPGTVSFPLEADILVDGVVVARERLFNVGVSAPPDRCDGQVACDGGCRVRLVRGEAFGQFDGNCDTVPTGDCVCSASFDLTAAEEIEVSAGSVLTVVLDPDNVVPEFDETNNVFTLTIGAPASAPALDGSDTFISPFGENCPFTMFTFNATEPLIVNSVTVTVTGDGAAPNATVEHRGDGAHKVTFDTAVPPGEWARVDMEVTGTDSGQNATLTVFAGHQPLDITGDGCTNIRDATAFGEEFSGPKRPERIDVNCDGRVDPRDATAFGNNWFGRAPATWAWANTCLPDKP